MAWKLYTDTNYLILESTSDEIVHRRLKYEVTVKKHKLNDTLYDFWDSINSYLRVNFSDLQDVGGDPWDDQASLEAFINSNTGLGDPTVGSASIVTKLNTTNALLSALSKAEDSVHVSGDFGIMALAVANEAGINISGADGDYTPIRVKRDGTVYALSDGNLVASTIVIDDNFTAFERRLSYFPSTRTYTVGFYVPGTNNVGVPVGTVLFPEELSVSMLSDIWSFLVNAGTEDGSAIGNFSRLAIGGKSVIAETYIPAYSSDEAVQAAFDQTTGRLLVQDDKIESSATTVEITSIDTDYVDSETIDLRGYQRVTILPEVTTVGGTNAYYLVGWSMDGIKWLWETLDAPAAPSGGYVEYSQNIVVRKFTSSFIPAVKPNAAVTLEKRARYMKIAQASDAAATTVVALYNLQKLK